MLGQDRRTKAIKLIVEGLSMLLEEPGASQKGEPAETWDDDVPLTDDGFDPALSPVVEFGHNEGQKLCELNEKDLRWHRKVAAERVKDPDRQKYLKENRAWLSEIDGEMTRRKAGGKVY